jgi:hypothetical protein
MLHKGLHPSTNEEKETRWKYPRESNGFSKAQSDDMLWQMVIEFYVLILVSSDWDKNPLWGNMKINKIYQSGCRLAVLLLYISYCKFSYMLLSLWQSNNDDISFCYLKYEEFLYKKRLSVHCSPMYPLISKHLVLTSVCLLLIIYIN